MGQTLSHGVYLPAEGERNCYSGLASNWNLLDTAIGDIDGKASATHTHGNITNDGKVGTDANKPLITGTGGAVQAGAFGNQANTFCEGNDSRLSDARTPVAHTHLTADVTDLLNSAHTWTGDNTYTKYLNAVINGCEIGVAPLNNNKNGILFKDKNGVNIGWLRHSYDPNGELSIEMLVSNKYKNGALDPTGTQIYQGVKQTITSNGTSYFSWSGYVNNSFSPLTTETFNIGDSTHQWNNLYAKNYYYNGTAWGLDKTNTWTGNNKFTDLTVSSISTIDITQSTLASATISANLPFKDNGNRYWGAIRTQVQTDRSNILKFTVSNWKTDGTQGTTDLCFSYDANLDKKSFYPTSGNVELGNSTNKWKALNGINPGALSLPDTTRQEPIDTTNWVYSYTAPNVYYPPEDGWLAVACSGSDYIQIDGSTGWGISLSKGYDGYCTGIIPVKKNVRMQIRIKETSSGSVVVRKASFYPGTGDPSFTVTTLNNS